MPTWREDIQEAYRRLGGAASYEQLYQELGRIRGKTLTSGKQAGVRREVENHSSDSENWKPHRPDLFYSVEGKGKGVWGLRSMRDKPNTIQNCDNLNSTSEINNNDEPPYDGTDQVTPGRREYIREITLRNRRHVIELKALYGGRCQVGGEAILDGIAGDVTEVHHIDWLTHGGSDTKDNMVVISPNLHAAIHASESSFDWENLAFIINGTEFPLILNKHLKKKHF